MLLRLSASSTTNLDGMNDESNDLNDCQDQRSQADRAQVEENQIGESVSDWRLNL